MANNKQGSKAKAVPFFARYLEGQIPQELSADDLKEISGGGDFKTEKYPSDSDEAETQKYPSDSDEADVSI
ncbi:MAG: microviridin/marinostatin family tricyclic proteinase inhibitor [Cyanobacteria bacterium J06635_15]